MYLNKKSNSGKDSRKLTLGTTIKQASIRVNVSYQMKRVNGEIYQFFYTFINSEMDYQWNVNRSGNHSCK